MIQEMENYNNMCLSKHQKRTKISNLETIFWSWTFSTKNGSRIVFVKVVVVAVVDVVALAHVVSDDVDLDVLLCIELSR